MTRAAKEKLRKSRAAQQSENYAINKYVRDLEASLKAAGMKQKELETELKKVKAELKSTREQLKREKASNQQLRQASTQITGKYNAAIKALKNQVKNAENTSKVTIKPAKASKEQVFEMYRQTNYAHFWSRVLEMVEWKDDRWTEPGEAERKLAEAQAEMDSWDSQRIREFVRRANLRSTWYDSDAQWNSEELRKLRAKSLYDLIMTYRPKF